MATTEWNNRDKINYRYSFWKTTLRIIISPILGFFVGGIFSKIIQIYTDKKIILASFEAIALISLGTIIVWLILSTFGVLKSTRNYQD